MSENLEAIYQLEQLRTKGLFLAQHLADVLTQLAQKDERRAHLWSNKSRSMSTLAADMEERLNHLIDLELRREA